MLVSCEFYVKRNIPSMDVSIRCPLCDRKSHLMVTGRKKIDAVRDYISSGTRFLTQDLPIKDASEREFLRSGYCREHLSMFGEPSKNIRYKRNSSVKFIGKE